MRHGAVPAFSSSTRARVSVPACDRRELVARASAPRAGRQDGMVTDGFQSRTSLRGVEPLLVRACRREPVERTPVWFMRQAGRSLPEYRAIRERYGLFDIVGQPELCAEVTLQPVRRHDVDAAVMFADIMSPVLGMGVERRARRERRPGGRASRSARAPMWIACVVPEPEESVPTILEAVRLVRAALRDDQAVIGFCGGPFTVAGYLSRGSRAASSRRSKAMMYREPDDVARADGQARGAVRALRRGEGRARAPTSIQVFDSWVGALSPCRLRGVRRAVLGAHPRRGRRADDPLRHRATATLLSRDGRAGGDVIGLDWRMPLDARLGEVGEDRGVQGNLDPAVLLGPWERIEAAALDDARARARGPAGPHLQPRARRAAADGSGRARRGSPSSCRRHGEARVSERRSS